MIGKTIIELPAIGSTNTYAVETYPLNDFDDGTVIRALEQFAGRGQNDRNWNSEAGKNLTFTVCLKPAFLPPQRQFQLNKVITLGILDFLESAVGSGQWAVSSGQLAVGSQQSAVGRRHSLLTTDYSLIKWPNDIYIGNQKLGGILIENRIMGSVFAASFAGIGLNINQTRFAPDIPNPVSLIHILRHEIVLRDALQTLCGFLDIRYESLKHRGHAELDREFDCNLMGFDEQRSFLRNGETVQGRITGVDDSGRLKVEMENGIKECFSHGEIELVI